MVAFVSIYLVMCMKSDIATRFRLLHQQRNDCKSLKYFYQYRMDLNLR